MSGILLGSMGLASSAGKISSKKVGAAVTNDELTRQLELLADSNATFTTVRVVQTYLRDPVSSASPSQQGQHGPVIPNFLGAVHHESVILTIQTRRGRTEYLQMDFGRDGLSWNGSAEMPQIPDQIPGTERMTQISNGSPQRLIDLLARLIGVRYNLVHFNCCRFARLVEEMYSAQHFGFDLSLFRAHLFQYRMDVEQAEEPESTVQIEELLWIDEAIAGTDEAIAGTNRQLAVAMAG